MLYVHPSVELYMEHYRFYVCNPTTKQFKAIAFPFQFQYADSNRIYGVNLAFDPTHSPHFKVVCVLGKSSLDSYYLHVYDSKTDTWNPSPNLQYLLIHQKPHFFLPLCFADAPFTDNQIFRESRGHLQVIMFPKSAVAFDVLEMEEDYSAWSVAYHVNLHSVRAAFSDVVASCNHRFQASVLSVVRAEREEDSEVVLNVFDMVVSYNFKDGTFKFIRYLVLCREVAARGLRYTWRNAFPFIETLCPVDRACN
ncbi:hypothetical protein M0R45_018825 [Rubus argutus]|uniref:Uncharacterized protein n=1 Tax=Rubus argutus TaxID=59490 RepID=A0AAW1X5D6_RUBAR